MDRVVLLFLHGGSYTKECWDPIIRRIKQSPLLQRVPCETVAFDWRFHGEKSDHSVGATISYVHGNKAKPRSDHPLRVWVDWGLDDLRDVVKKLRANDKDGVKTKIVAIGHSMGASAMLQVEMENPGTFQGIIAFEPVHGKSRDEANAVTDMLVSVTLRRPGEWYGSQSGELLETQESHARLVWTGIRGKTLSSTSRPERLIAAGMQKVWTLFSSTAYAGEVTASTCSRPRRSRRRQFTATSFFNSTSRA
jgi:pimeloyl-ACP methyl ester carboxylesterase